MLSILIRDLDVEFFFDSHNNLKKIIAEVLNVDEEEITMDTTFVDDLGADSLDIFQFFKFHNFTFLPVPLNL